MKENTDNPPDPFDPENFRIDQSFLQQPVAKKLLVTVPVRKPHRQDFIRAHPSMDYQLPAALVNLHDRGETYLVLPNFVSALGENEHFFATLYLCTTRQKAPFLWPVKIPSPEGRKNEWHNSAITAVGHAMKHWVRVVSNMSAGAYEVLEAVGNFTEPEWPEASLREILGIAFRGKVIDSPDHPVIKKLRGEI
jgi:hypothetical protein